jgi:hypothetical protein
MAPPDTSASLLPGRSQPLIALVVATCLAAGAVWFVSAGGLAGRLVHHDTAPAVDSRFTVNINAAGEIELAQLPGVPGIGPATLAAMRPHLRPIRQPKPVPQPFPVP